MQKAKNHDVLNADQIRIAPAAGPAGVDKPPGGAILLHLLGEHGGVLGRVEHDERRAEAGRERGLRLLDAVLRAGDQGGVAADEVIHGLRQVQLADRREHPERVARQEDDVLGVRPDARDLGVGDVLDRVGSPGVLCSKTSTVRSEITEFSPYDVCDWKDVDCVLGYLPVTDLSV